MRKTFALLFTLALTASCTEQEILAPVAPATPDSDVLIVPGMSIGASGSAEATPWNTPTADTRGMTRAASYPYVIADAWGRKTIVVAKDNNGAVEEGIFHERWVQTPDHVHGTFASNKLTYSDMALSVAPRFEIADKDAGPAAAWGSTNAGCTSPWRRPTVGEMRLMRTLSKQSQLTDVATFGNMYWTAGNCTCSHENGASYISFEGDWDTHIDKTTLYLTRCVRDAYPYVTTNADGKASVIVSQDEYGNSGAVLHAPWEQTPQHLYTNATLNSISYRFEVAQTQSANSPWISTNVTCTAPWRMPTYAELVTIYKARTQLELSTPFTANKTYWSASEADASTVHVLNFNGTDTGYTGNDSKAGTNYFRCVRDLNDNFTAAPGSKVATLWGYTNTTGLLADNLVPPTVIKNTTTGFELESARYFPADGNKKLYFYAHAPNGIGETIANTNNATVTYTLTGQTDVLWAKDDRGIARNSTPAWQEQPFFLFQHKLMRLAFKVVADGSFPLADSPAVTKITAKNVNTKVVLTVPTGATVFSTPADFSLSPTTNNAITTAGTELTDILMVEPKVTITLSVVAGGVTYPDITLTLTGEGAGTAGMGHLITLTFKQNQIVPAAVIIPWETTGTGSGDLI